MRTRGNVKRKNSSQGNHYDLPIWLSVLALFISICNIGLHLRSNSSSSVDDCITEENGGGRHLEKRAAGANTISNARKSGSFVVEKVNDVFDRCHFRQKQKVVYSHDLEPEDERVVEVEFAATMGFVILTADCSSTGTQEKQFFQPDSTEGQFRCRCISENNDSVYQLPESQENAVTIDKTQRKPITCIAHYWECPTDNDGDV